VTYWAQVFLGIIAVATLLMALVQVSVILCGLMLARRVARMLDQLERDAKPIVESLNAIARDAARAAALAAVQVERVDKVFSDLAVRIEQTASTVQKAIVNPLRDGAAVLAGVRAALAVLKDLTGRSRGAGVRAEDDDALFIG
jgi:hypothetical protein